MTEVCLLGELCVYVDGAPLPLGHMRQRTILTALLVDIGHAVSIEQLIDRVWEDRPPLRARSVVYSYLSRLRTALRASGALAIERRSAGYLVTGEPGLVDLHRFRGLVRQARAAGPTEAARRYEQALGLWRGPALLGLRSAWCDTVRVRLHHERLVAQLDYVDVALRLGTANRLLPDLVALTREHPLDERLAGQLVLALHHSGRQADALAHFHATRRLLNTELGIDPGADLNEAHRRVLAGEPAPAPPSTHRGDRARTAGIRRLPRRPALRRP
jgi:DNA-binding SARP family transcriptional activator